MVCIMTVEMRTIGEILDSRPAGREALLALRPRLSTVKDLVLDFGGVKVLTPSFADEFVTPLIGEFDLKLMNTQGNITVQKTLEFLAEDWPRKIAME
jgi:hypothetical protein